MTQPRSFKVQIVVLGRSLETVEVQPPGTVAAAFLAANVDAQGKDVRVNGASATLDDPLAGGDLITVIPMIRGGGHVTMSGWIEKEPRRDRRSQPADQGHPVRLAQRSRRTAVASSRRGARAAVLILTCLISSACTGAAAPIATPGATGQSSVAPSVGALTRVQIAYPAISPASYPLWVAKEIGAFEKYGLDANLIFVEGGQRAAAGLVSGATQFALVAGPNIMDPNAQGADIVALMSMGDRLTDVIVGGEGITAAEQLRDGTVASNEPGGEADLATRYAMTEIGLTPDVDVTVLAVGGESTRVAALVSGNVQGSYMDVSHVPEMEELGFTVLYSFLDGELPYQKNAVATTRSYMASDPVVVENVVKAMLEGVAYYKNHQDEAVSIAARYSATAELSPISVAYGIYAPDLPYVPKLGPDGFATIQEWSSDENVKGLDPATQFDNSVLEALEESGFTDQVETQ